MAPPGADPADPFNPPERWLSTEHFALHPERLWHWHLALLREYRQATPNAGHHAITALQQHAVARDGWLRVHTQNIDTLHEQAGTQEVSHLHGRLDRWRSLHSDGAGETGDRIPLDSAGHATRPDVVFFGDPLPPGAFEAAYDDACRCDLLIVVGSSLAVSPVNTLPLHAVRESVPVLYIGPERPQLTFPHLHLIGRAEELLPALC